MPERQGELACQAGRQRRLTGRPKPIFLEQIWSTTSTTTARNNDELLRVVVPHVLGWPLRLLDRVGNTARPTHVTTPSVVARGHPPAASMPPGPAGTRPKWPPGDGLGSAVSGDNVRDPTRRARRASRGERRPSDGRDDHPRFRTSGRGRVAAPDALPPRIRLHLPPGYDASLPRLTLRLARSTTSAWWHGYAVALRYQRRHGHLSHAKSEVAPEN